MNHPQLYYSLDNFFRNTHIAPLGLRYWGVDRIYKHIAPLGLPLGADKFLFLKVAFVCGPLRKIRNALGTGHEPDRNCPNYSQLYTIAKYQWIFVRALTAVVNCLAQQTYC